jgi:hypothetical protein
MTKASILEAPFGDLGNEPLRDNPIKVSLTG